MREKYGKKEKVILDCDPGHDDAFAIMLAAQHLDLLGVTTVGGNGFPGKHHPQRPAGAGRDRPVRREGLSRSCGSLHQGELVIADNVHGKTAMDGPPAAASQQER